MAVARVDLPAPIRPEMLMKIGYVGMCLKHAGVGDAFLSIWLLLSSTYYLSAIGVVRARRISFSVQMLGFKI